MLSSSQGSAFSCSLTYPTVDYGLATAGHFPSWIFYIPPSTHLDIIISTWQDRETCCRMLGNLRSLVPEGDKLKLGSSMVDSSLGSANPDLLNQILEARLGHHRGAEDIRNIYRVPSGVSSLPDAQGGRC